MQFIRIKQDLVDNIITLEGYLNSSDEKEKKFAQDLIEKALTMVVYKVNGENHFAPGRFLGYAKNTMAAHLSNDETDGKETNAVIDKALNITSFSNDTTEGKFLQYLEKVGLSADNNKRRYWRLKDPKGKNYNFDM